MVQRLVGADPEAFLVNEAGKFISSIGLIGGTKWNPRQVGDGFAIQEDNVAVEYNIPPAKDVNEFIASINKGKQILSDHVKEFGLKLALVPSAIFDEDQLSNPQAREFGCEPDINAWTKRINPRPKAKDPALRSTGGHVHLTSKADPFILGQWMDFYNGAAFVLIDQDQRRRELYGKAGAIRIKDYPGIEYRTLSCFWLRSDELIRFVYERSILAANRAERGDILPTNVGVLIRKAINKSDKAAVQALADKYPEFDLDTVKGLNA